MSRRDLDAHHQTLWDASPKWKESFQHSHIGWRRALAKSLAFGLGLFILTAIGFGLLNNLLSILSGFSFILSDRDLFIFSLSIAGVAVAPLTIMIALVIFWAGNAEAIRDRAQSILMERLNDSDQLVDELRPFSMSEP